MATVGDTLFDDIQWDRIARGRCPACGSNQYYSGDEIEITGEDGKTDFMPVDFTCSDCGLSEGYDRTTYPFYAPGQSGSHDKPEDYQDGGKEGEQTSAEDARESQREVDAQGDEREEGCDGCEQVRGQYDAEAEVGQEVTIELDWSTDHPPLVFTSFRRVLGHAWEFTRDSERLELARGPVSEADIIALGQEVRKIGARSPERLNGIVGPVERTATLIPFRSPLEILHDTETIR